ncbi:amino acid ABC transporter permease [Legionella taurinensis]|uniref:Amino acid ABC transporter permease n=1 Tax=Legionella taurinensis TaxID=70611 RepID=A0A3A5LG17_9GAMM|nr:amino acid ABC transporter permease [Legionella taurinensis]MDX1838609.1 amino acid ABC transporter permease [Legionella taurinensis]PUT39047.1 glutamine ABC transporter permease [Legionella taurinensis]PUT41134.1 glutamine ABC transporter permease [Legionella taurinensis]PUT43509.1 glutamine ABC transporter permease [Legionella taurinensis]PUT46526.1 glutamine ABC transporter permease [Legionella taurinensis]
MNELSQNVGFVGQGITLTLQLLAGGITLGLVLGSVWAICRYYNLASWGINRLISILRGTPLILQLSLIYFSAPALTGVRPGILAAGILAFGLNSSAYFAEILRAGIENLPKGQFEAAATLKIPTFYLWKDIILPQVIRAIFPAIINEIIALLKETALISTIGGMDLMRNAQSLAAQQFTYFMPLCIAGCYYYSLVLFIEWLGKTIEKRGVYDTNH